MNYGKATITFETSSPGLVLLNVSDIKGKEIIRIMNTFLQPGKYEVPFVASALSPGIYLVRLITPDNSLVKKVLLIK